MGNGRRIGLVAAGIAVILAVNVALAFSLSGSVTERILRHEGELSRDFLNSILAAENTAATLFDQPAPSPALKSFSAHMLGIPGVVRVNIYSPDRFIRFSTNAGLTGLRFEDNPELVDSLNGALVSKLEEISSELKNEHIALNLPRDEKVIEAYSPVSDKAGKVVAVVELYRSGEEMQRFIGDVTRMVWISMGLTAAALLLALFALVRRKPQAV